MLQADLRGPGIFLTKALGGDRQLWVDSGRRAFALEGRLWGFKRMPQLDRFLLFDLLNSVP
jgi:phage gp46-like protein